VCGAELQGKCQKIADAVSSYYGIGRVQCDAAFLQRIKTQQRGDAVGGGHDQTGDGGGLQLQPCGQLGQRCGQQTLYKGEKRQDPGKKRADTAYNRVDFRQGGQPLQQHNTGRFLQNRDAKAEQGQTAYGQRDAVEDRADRAAAGFEKLGASPNVFSDTDGWDYEAISDCAPDVILAAYSGFSEEEYDMLSQIAPTVAYPSVAWSTTWREETIVDATAMGMKSEGEALVAETDAMIQKKLAEYPAIEGKKAAFFWLSASDLSTFYIYTTLDPRAAFLTDIGMPLPDSVAALDNGKDFALTVSAENANQFSDVEIIITYGTDELLTALQADPLLSEISAVKNGAVVLLDSSDDLAASSTPSILSIPYTIDRYLEVLNAVAEKAV
jgi:ABC-type Fe3+-hydroxamate transport system substrate-binding protein